MSVARIAWVMAPSGKLERVLTEGPELDVDVSDLGRTPCHLCSDVATCGTPFADGVYRPTCNVHRAAGSRCLPAAAPQPAWARTRTNPIDEAALADLLQRSRVA